MRKSQIWTWYVSSELSSECYSLGIGQNIQNEVSLERYIFADVVDYQFTNLNWKLNRSKEECFNIVPHGSYTTLAVRKILMIYSFDYHWNCKGKIVVGYSWDVKVKAMKGTNLGVAQALFEP